MVYIFFYEISPFRFYRLCPTLQYALNLVSFYAGDLDYPCHILPYKPKLCSLEVFRTVISGGCDSNNCDITRQDILEFEFQYDISLLITDLYE